MLDASTFGHRVRHFRKKKGLTLEGLAGMVGRQAPFLSLLENGRKEPKLTDITALAAALGVATSDLLDPVPPNRRAQLELDIERAQRHPLYQQLGLPHLKPTVRVGDDVLVHVVSLFRALTERPMAGTAEDLRNANAETALWLRASDCYLASVEEAAASALRSAGYGGSGPLSSRNIYDLAAVFGHTIELAEDMPPSLRSIVDRGVIYVAQRNALRTRQARKAVLQTLGQLALDHEPPVDFSTYLHQRVESAYFASAVLVPETAAIPVLTDAQKRRDLSIEDLREVFNVSYEMAAYRLANLATCHLEITAHLIRSDESGIVWKAYENDGVPFPRDQAGGVEAQRLCREWGARQAYTDRFSLLSQYTDTPAGTYFCLTQIEDSRTPGEAVTFGVPFEAARWFRGRDTDVRRSSACPNGDCCRHQTIAPDGVTATARAQSRLVGLLAQDPYPEVDYSEVSGFLARHRPS